MRILLVNVDLLGGQLTHVDELAAALADEGAQVGVARWGGRAQRMPACWRRGVPTWPVHSVADLVGVARRFSADVLHAHSARTWRRVAAACTDGRPFVLTAHGPGLDTHGNRLALTTAAAVIVTGPATRRSLRTPGRVVTIANGIDLERFRPEPKAARPRVAYVGRVDAERARGFSVFVEATRRLAADVALIGAGGRPAPHVRCSGWLADPSPALRRLDVAVGVGRSLREAQACGAVGVVLGRRLHGALLPGVEPPDPEAPDAWYGEWLPPVPWAEASAHLRATLQALMDDRPALRAAQRFSRQLAERYADGREKARRHLELYQAVRDQRVRARGTRASGPASVTMR